MAYFSPLINRKKWIQQSCGLHWNLDCWSFPSKLDHNSVLFPHLKLHSFFLSFYLYQILFYTPLQHLFNHLPLRCYFLSSLFRSFYITRDLSCLLLTKIFLFFSSFFFFWKRLNNLLTTDSLYLNFNLAH